MCAMQAFAQNPQDPLPVDPQMRIGKLENGLTYYIRHNEYPKNQCCFYIAQKVGSMQEEEDQRGLAHLLEHMAFNGSEHFPGGRMIKFLEENGIKFGAELNAYTSLEETVYNINNVPTNKGEFLIDSCLQILADWSGGVLLEDEEIDKERGVVKSEYLMRNSPSQRLYDSIMPIVMSDSKYAHRMPIGLMSVVENCPYDALRAYYKKWYHPSYQGIVVVGDVDVDMIEGKIRNMFSKFTNPENYAPIVPCLIPDNDKPIFAFAKDKEQKNTDINLLFKFEQFPKEKKQTYEYFNYSLKFQMAYYMTYFRITDYAKKPESPLLNAVGGLTNFIYSKTKSAYMLRGSSKPGRELESYMALLRESIRIGKYGFTQAEFDRAKADIISEVEAQYKEREKQENSYYVQACVDNFLEGDDLMSLEDTYKLILKGFETLTLDDVNKFIASIINADGKNMVVFNFSPEKEGQFYFDSQIYKEATDKVLSDKNIKPIVEQAVAKSLLKKEPKAGSIRSILMEDLTGARVLYLSNGAKVYTKKTDFKDDEILFYAHSFGGGSLYDVADNQNLRYLSYIMSNVGLAKFSLSQLQKMMAGKVCNLNAGLDNLSEELNGYSSPADLEYFMQLLYSFFVQPGSNAQDFEFIRQQIRQQISTANLDPRNTLSDSIQAIRFNHNPRAMQLAVEDVDKMNFKRMQQIYKERFADASDFVFFFVGNFDEATLDALVCKYIASLPAKNVRENFRKHQMDINQNYVFCCAEREMTTPESRVSKYYTILNADYTLSNSLTYQILAQIIQNRQLKSIREEASIAYNTRCSLIFHPSEEDGKAELTFNTFNPVKPEYANRANQMMDSIMENALAEGFTQTELDNVREFLIKKHVENQRVNNYWMSQLERSVIYNADFVSGFDSAINSITVESLQKALNDFINNSIKHTYMLLPEGVVQVE